MNDPANNPVTQRFLLIQRLDGYLFWWAALVIMPWMVMLLIRSRRTPNALVGGLRTKYNLEVQTWGNWPVILFFVQDCIGWITAAAAAFYLFWRTFLAWKGIYY